MLEIGDPDTNYNQTEECVVGIVDAFREENCFQPRSVIGDGFADVNAFVVIIFKMLKIIPVSKVNRRSWPFLGGNHYLPILVNQRDECGLR